MRCVVEAIRLFRMILRELHIFLWANCVRQLLVAWVEESVDKFLKDIVAVSSDESDWNSSQAANNFSYPLSISQPKLAEARKNLNIGRCGSLYVNSSSSPF